jgi:two-component system KDP operon response regulator KdpE
MEFQGALSNGHDLQGGPPPPRLLLLFSEPESIDLLRAFPADRFESAAFGLSLASAELIDQVEPDLVLLACPGETEEALVACEQARALTDRTLVALSASGDGLLVTRALEAGVDEFLSLPIGDDELRARLGALLRRSLGMRQHSAMQQVGGLTLWPQEQAVSVDGKKIALSPIQFRLLFCLASAPGKVLTHQTLMSRVWGAEYVDSRHYLRLYIRYLRERLEADPNNPRLILSEWGVGYRFEPPYAEITV